MNTILHIMQCTNLGGMEQVSCRIMREMMKDNMGIQFRITTPRPFGEGKTLIHEIDPRARDFQYKGKFGWRTLNHFSSCVKDISIGCSHVWVTGTCTSSLAAIRKLKIPKVLSHHYHHFENRWSWIKWRAFYEILCRDLNALTFPTAFTLNEALRIAPWLRNISHVVPNGFDVKFTCEEERLQRQQLSRCQLGLPSKAIVVMNAGWLIPRKRHDIFIKTAAEVKRRLPESYFVICGGGYLENKLKHLADELGISKSIRFTGWVDNLSQYYSASDIVLFNSDFDTLPCVPMEAAANGCIVVASLIYGGLAEFIEHEITGFLFDQHDVPNLAESIIKLAYDQNLCRQFREASVRKLKAKYSMEIGIAFYKNIFWN